MITAFFIIGFFVVLVLALMFMSKRHDDCYDEPDVQDPTPITQVINPPVYTPPVPPQHSEVLNRNYTVLHRKVQAPVEYEEEDSDEDTVVEAVAVGSALAYLASEISSDESDDNDSQQSDTSSDDADDSDDDDQDSGFGGGDSGGGGSSDDW